MPAGWVRDIPVVGAAGGSDRGLCSRFGNESRCCTNEPYHQVTTSHNFSIDKRLAGFGRVANKPWPPIRSVPSMSYFFFFGCLQKHQACMAHSGVPSSFLIPESEGALHCACAPPVQVMEQPAQPLVAPTLQEVGSGGGAAGAGASAVALGDAEPTIAATPSPKVRLPFLPHQSRTCLASSAKAAALVVYRGSGTCAFAYASR